MTLTSEELDQALAAAFKRSGYGGWRVLSRDVALAVTLLGLIGFGIGIGRQSAKLDSIAKNVTHEAELTQARCLSSDQIMQTEIDDIHRRLNLIEQHVRP